LPEQVAWIRGRTYNRAKRKRGGTGANQHTEQIPQSEGTAKGPTAERLANDLGVSPRTLKNDGAYAQAVEGRSGGPQRRSNQAEGEAEPGGQQRRRGAPASSHQRSRGVSLRRRRSPTEGIAGDVGSPWLEGGEPPAAPGSRGLTPFPVGFPPYGGFVGFWRFPKSLTMSVA
jgi:hypothetical protein